jgi:endoglucanase
LLLSLAEKQPERDIWLSFSVQEEVGCRGAKVIGEIVKPDIGIAIDATTAADITGSTQRTCACHVGKGAVVSFADGATLYDQAFYQEIHALASQNNIPSQTKNRIAGGNDACALQRSHIGVRTAAISLPCRYIHSPSCVCQWQDVLAMESLLHLLAESLPE